MDDMLRMDARVPARVLARFRRRVANDLARARASVDRAGAASGAPFLIVTPLGLPHAGALAGGLAAAEVGVRARGTLADWPRLCTPLYVRECDAVRLFKAWVFEALWRKLFPHSRAEVWWLDGMAGFRRLAGIKRRLREGLAPSRSLRVVAHGQDFHARLHALHLPDEADLPRDAAWIAAHQRRPATSRPPRAGVRA